jgi:ABC-2 type transport system permease protein
VTVSIATGAAPAGTKAAREQPHGFAGVRELVRFAARRDRVRGVVWVACLVGLAAISTSAVDGLYTTPEDLVSYAAVAQADATFKAMTGPGYGLDDPSLGAIAMNELSMSMLLGVALMSIFLVVRHTRAEEETDRAELVRAAPVGRHAALLATMLWVGGIGLAIGVGTVATQLIWLPATGSIAFGAAVTAFSWVFVGVTAVTAQLASGARSATSSAGAILAVAFALRAVGDIDNGWLTWVSPLGWAQGIRAFADEQWWVLALLVATAAALGGWSIRLSAGRDLGHGFFEGRPGRPRATRWLATPLTLSLRLQRSALIGWTVGLVLMGFFMGMVANQAEELAENDAIAEMMAQAGEGTFTELFLATIISMLGLLATGFVVSSVLRARSEERAMRVAPVLATPVGRVEWLFSHTSVALCGSLVMMVAASCATGVGYAVRVGDVSEIGPLVAAGLVVVPALWALGGFAAALFAARSGLASLAWAAVAFVAFIGLLGQNLDVPHWIRNLSPFEHIPALPAASFELAPVVATTVVAVFLLAYATHAIEQRDLG